MASISHSDSTTRRGFGPLGRAFAALAAAAIAVVPMTGMAPEPDPVARRWELQFEPGPLRMASFDVPNVGPRRYFYMTYKVINNSGTDLLFAPAFEMSTGEGDVIRSGRDVPQSVTESLVQSTQNLFIQDQISIIGDMLQGEENARDGIVVWNAVDLNPEQVMVYVAGLSGETATVTAGDGKQKFTLRKTMQIDYTSPGDLVHQKAQEIPAVEKRWIMR